MAHWIIEDKGFGGVTYKCSNCREAWNEYYFKFPKDYCLNCGESIDEDMDEYIEETIGHVFEDMPKVKTYSDFAREALIFPHTIGDITYYSKEELIKWVEVQQKINEDKGIVGEFDGVSITKENVNEIIDELKRQYRLNE